MQTEQFADNMKLANIITRYLLTYSLGQNILLMPTTEMNLLDMKAGERHE